MHQHGKSSIERFAQRRIQCAAINQRGIRWRRFRSTHYGEVFFRHPQDVSNSECPVPRVRSRRIAAIIATAHCFYQPMLDERLKLILNKNSSERRMRVQFPNAAELAVIGSAV